MKHQLTHSWLIMMIVFVLGLSPASPASAQTGPEGTPQPEGESATAEALGIRPISVYADPNVSDFFQAPPAEVLQQVNEMSMGLNVVSPTFIIDYVPAGSQNYYGDTCQTFPNEAKAAFTYATNIWSAYLNPPHNVPIHIEACWMNMGSSSILGYGGYADLYKNYPPFQLRDTWYSTALANGLVGYDLNGSAPEIFIAYNSNFASNFYYEKGTTPPNKYNLTSIVLHEIAHGLGFAGSMGLYSSSSAWWGWPSYNNGPLFPEVYDTFIIDGAGRSLINTSIYANPSSSLFNALTSGNIYFNGPMARQKNGGNPVKIYAPSKWSQGSSYAHLDEIYNGTPNALMTYSVSYGETNYSPGPITLGLLNDLGWPINYTGVNNNPTNITLSKLSVEENLLAGAAVGTFATIDPDPGDTHTYSLSACAYADNSKFTLQGATLKTAEPFNREAKSTYSICVRSTDPNGAYLDRAFTITVDNVNEAGTRAYPNLKWARPDTAVGERVATILTDDPDIGDTITFVLNEAYGDASLFTLNGANLHAAAPLSSTEGDTYTIQVTYTDSAGKGPGPQTITFTVLDYQQSLLPISFR